MAYANNEHQLGNVIRTYNCDPAVLICSFLLQRNQRKSLFAGPLLGKLARDVFDACKSRLCCQTLQSILREYLPYLTSNSPSLPIKHNMCSAVQQKPYTDGALRCGSS